MKGMRITCYPGSGKLGMINKDDDDGDDFKNVRTDTKQS